MEFSNSNMKAQAFCDPLKRTVTVRFEVSKDAPSRNFRTERKPLQACVCLFSEETDSERQAETETQIGQEREKRKRCVGSLWVVVRHSECLSAFCLEDSADPSPLTVTLPPNMSCQGVWGLQGCGGALVTLQSADGQQGLASVLDHPLAPMRPALFVPLSATESSNSNSSCSSGSSPSADRPPLLLWPQPATGESRARKSDSNRKASDTELPPARKAAGGFSNAAEADPQQAPARTGAEQGKGEHGLLSGESGGTCRWKGEGEGGVEKRWAPPVSKKGLCSRNPFDASTSPLGSRPYPSPSHCLLQVFWVDPQLPLCLAWRPDQKGGLRLVLCVVECGGNSGGDSPSRSRKCELEFDDLIKTHIEGEDALTTALEDEEGGRLYAEFGGGGVVLREIWGDFVGEAGDAVDVQAASVVPFVHNGIDARCSPCSSSVGTSGVTRVGVVVCILARRGEAGGRLRFVLLGEHTRELETSRGDLSAQAMTEDALSVVPLPLEAEGVGGRSSSSFSFSSGRCPFEMGDPWSLPLPLAGRGGGRSSIGGIMEFAAPYLQNGKGGRMKRGMMVSPDHMPRMVCVLRVGGEMDVISPPYVAVRSCGGMRVERGMRAPSGAGRQRMTVEGPVGRLVSSFPRSRLLRWIFQALFISLPGALAGPIFADTLANLIEDWKEEGEEKGEGGLEADRESEEWESLLTPPGSPQTSQEEETEFAAFRHVCSTLLAAAESGTRGDTPVRSPPMKRKRDRGDRDDTDNPEDWGGSSSSGDRGAEETAAGASPRCEEWERLLESRVHLTARADTRLACLSSSFAPQSLSASLSPMRPEEAGCGTPPASATRTYRDMNTPLSLWVSNLPLTVLALHLMVEEISLLADGQRAASRLRALLHTLCVRLHLWHYADYYEAAEGRLQQQQRCGSGRKEKGGEPSPEKNRLGMGKQPFEVGATCPKGVQQKEREEGGGEGARERDRGRKRQFEKSEERQRNGGAQAAPGAAFLHRAVSPLQSLPVPSLTLTLGRLVSRGMRKQQIAFFEGRGSRRARRAKLKAVEESGKEKRATFGLSAFCFVLSRGPEGRQEGVVATGEGLCRSDTPMTTERDRGVGRQGDGPPRGMEQKEDDFDVPAFPGLFPLSRFALQLYSVAADASVRLGLHFGEGGDAAVFASLHGSLHALAQSEGLASSNDPWSFESDVHVATQAVSWCRLEGVDGSAQTEKVPGGLFRDAEAVVRFAVSRRVSDLWSAAFAWCPALLGPLGAAVAVLTESASDRLPPDACRLLGREDLAQIAKAKKALVGRGTGGLPPRMFPQLRAHVPSWQIGQQAVSSSFEGMGERGRQGVAVLRDKRWLHAVFGGDRRLCEAARLLDSSKPSILKLARTGDATDDSFLQLKSQCALKASLRTLSLPLGRGALTLGSTPTCAPSGNVPVPPVVLAVRFPPSPATFPLDAGSRKDEVDVWAEFNNGVGTGLSLAVGYSGAISGWLDGESARRSVLGRGRGERQRRFHQTVQCVGVREGLLDRGYHSGGVTGRWIRRQRDGHQTIAHAGFLLGLGLRGHLRHLSSTDIFFYLDRHHLPPTDGNFPPAVVTTESNAKPGSAVTPTRVALTLGVAASRIGSCDPEASKVCWVHLAALNGGYEMEVSSVEQVSALVGLGLIFCGSGFAQMADLLLAELTRRPSGLTDKSDLNREAYAFAAGFSLGLVFLRPNGAFHHRTEDPVERQQLQRLLLTLIHGGDLHALPSEALKYTGGVGDYKRGGEEGGGGAAGLAAGESPYQLRPAPADSWGPSSRSSRVLEGQPAHSYRGGLGVLGGRANAGVSGPGACLALGLSFFRSNDTKTAERIRLPSGPQSLTECRPDLLLYRVLARHLILWEKVCPSWAFLLGLLTPVLLYLPCEASGQLPGLASVARAEDMKGAKKEFEAGFPWAIALQARVMILAGSAWALGLKHAGTHDQASKKVLLELYHWFSTQRRCNLSPSVACGVRSFAAGRSLSCDPHFLDTAQNLVGLSLSVVMSGSGDLDVFRALRGSRVSPVGLVEAERKAQSEAASGQAQTAHATTVHLSGTHSYGWHQAVHQAVGFLFLGGGQFAFRRDPFAVACLILSTAPRFPSQPSDSKGVPPACRHLYALAAQYRCVHACAVLPSEAKGGTSQPADSLRVPVEAETACLSSGRRVRRRFVLPALLPPPETLVSLSLRASEKDGECTPVSSLPFWPLTLRNERFIPPHPMTSSSPGEAKTPAGWSLDPEQSGFERLLSDSCRGWRLSLQPRLIGNSIWEERETYGRADSVMDSLGLPPLRTLAHGLPFGLSVSDLNRTTRDFRISPNGTQVRGGCFEAHARDLSGGRTGSALIPLSDAKGKMKVRGGLSGLSSVEGADRLAEVLKGVIEREA
uniref:Uncharacterized protein n=1 Tax=Chromera velia CCMP2878 TaxID=1169474 RepID=A0A0G4I0B8_9ALVE|eukprot:Cvel_9902.t1-p1 / transcript=Cvel_9902.t1 / gene=Cvel_9902 / organism=Chromera_velia_CCMP2878 / gene_product=Negative regulator of mitosis, putative / transcript_product=Negative regulator of mitosis, putative / location=Cvel_scaffold584:54281-68734(+) / protein_length=2371 / sequence_SO=supercontig / SO=protein_coding / is_pseudo=false